MIKVKDEAEEVLGQPDIPLSAAQRLTEKRTLAAPPGRTSRKGAFWLGRHLQNASLREAPHQKTHSGGSGARRMRLYVTSNPRMRLSVECAFPHLRKRGVGSRKSAFWQTTSRKSALWQPLPHGKAQSGPRPQSTPHGKAHSAYDRALDVTEWHSRALQARRQAPRLSVTYRRPVPPAHLRPSPALPCDLRTHQCPTARSAARTRAPQPRPTYARKETDHEGIRATA